jgi:hypothetical protein
MSIFIPKYKLVTSPLLPSLRQFLSSTHALQLLDQSESGRGEARNLYEAIKGKMPKWLNNHVDLAEFPNIYQTAGISGGIESWLLHEQRPLNIIRGDYRWPGLLHNKFITLEHWADFNGGVLYISNPSAIDGGWIEDWGDFLEAEIPHVIDMAYLGTAKPKYLQTSYSTEMVFYSLSKTFGLHSFRSGWVFSRKRIDHLEALNEAGYLSFPGLYLSNKIANELEPDYLFKSLRQAQARLCGVHNLMPADSVLFSNSNDPEYMYYRRRDDYSARIPIGNSLPEYI